ncbi:(2Fe-2S) ferredoxin domain-containing protein [Phormidium tenue FACHB-886]|nr:(2Fe-2S) ferredoxin domain-containing protein [Phormidium tenue FACHB-886]
MICQSKACRKGGAAKVLAAFRSHPLPEVQVCESGCLGQCGNGPMVVILPEQTWYNRVNPQEVPAVVDRHLQGGEPVQTMLYPKFH